METLPIVYRQGVAGDVGRLWYLDVICFDEPFRFSRRAMRRFALADNARVWVGEAGGELVGFVIMEVQGEVGYVVTLDVAPAWRRGGVARRLMSLAEAGLVGEGVQRVALHVFAGNEGAIQFYEGLGFERVEVASGFYGVGLDGLVYERELAAKAGTRSL